MATLAQLEPPAERFHDALTHGRSDVDQALLDHPHGIEELVSFPRGHDGRARPHHDADVIGAVAFGPAPDRQRHGGRIGRMVAEVPDEVRECLAELRRIDLHVQRCGLARDVDADRLPSGVAALDIRHGLVDHVVDVHYPEV